MFDFECSQEIEGGALNSIKFKLSTSLKTKEQEIHADQQHVQRTCTCIHILHTIPGSR